MVESASHWLPGQRRSIASLNPFISETWDEKETYYCRNWTKQEGSLYISGRKYKVSVAYLCSRQFWKRWHQGAFDLDALHSIVESTVLLWKFNH